jgi:SHO1 osmosensor
VQLAWIIAFVSSIISATSGAKDERGELIRFPNYAWWTIVFMFFCVIGVTVTVASGVERTYHVAVSNAFPMRTTGRAC